MEVQVIDRMLTVYLNEDGRKDVVIFSMQVFIEDNVGQVYSLIGDKFFENLPLISKALREKGIKVLRGTMIPKVAYTLKRKHKGHVNIGEEKSHTNEVDLVDVEVFL